MPDIKLKKKKELKFYLLKKKAFKNSNVCAILQGLFF